VTVVDVVDDGASGAATGVPTGFRINLKRVPSAVFISVTGLFSRSVTVGEPFAYEPPTIEIFAVCAVTETRWKSGWIDGSVELASGKLLPTATE